VLTSVSHPLLFVPVQSSPCSHLVSLASPPLFMSLVSLVTPPSLLQYAPRHCRREARPRSSKSCHPTSMFQTHESFCKVQAQRLMTTVKSAAVLQGHMYVDLYICLIDVSNWYETLPAASDRTAPAFACPTIHHSLANLPAFVISADLTSLTINDFCSATLMS
jgi:hypothetical protein